LIEERRSGFALVAALACVVLLGALIVGAFVAVTEETRVSATMALGERALDAAESAVEGEIEAWSPSYGDSLAIGDRAVRAVTTGKLPVVTTLIRLDSSLFWIIGDASSSGNSAAEAPLVRRRIAVLVRAVTDSAGKRSISRLEERPWSALF